MAEQLTRGYFDIVDELFLMKDSAIDKFAKVRFTEYEMNLWRKYGYSLSEVSLKARKYFEKRFLGGTSISNATEEELEKAFLNLGYAVGSVVSPEGETELSGCRKRCLRLMNELNDCLKSLGLRTMTDPERLLDWLTFEYDTVKNGFGLPIKDRGVEIRVFQNDQNLKEFKSELKELKKKNRALSMHDILRIITIRREKSVLL